MPLPDWVQDKKNTQTDLISTASWEETDKTKRCARFIGAWGL